MVDPFTIAHALIAAGLILLLAVWLSDPAYAGPLRVLQHNLRFWRWVLVPAAIIGFCVIGW